MTRVNQSNWFVEFPCVKVFLLVWLARAVNSVGLRLALSAGEMSGYTVGANEIKAQTLPLYQVKDKTQVIYVSPIALKLSKWLPGSSMEIGNAIAEELHQLTTPSGDDSPQLFTIKVVFPGFINFQLADITIATLLQNLIKIPPWIDQERVAFMLNKSEKKPEAFSLGVSSSIFPIQYAHARCCSLLRLAHREGIIVLEELDVATTPSYGKLITPQPIPWLNTNHQLRLVHSAERNLIYHFFGVLDALYCPGGNENPFSGAKVANTICESFEQFYAQCRIWGEVKRDSVELAQARLGLVAIAQALLKLLLVNFLGGSAPVEL